MADIERVAPENIQCGDEVWLNNDDSESWRVVDRSFGVLWVKQGDASKTVDVGDVVDAIREAR